MIKTWYFILSKWISGEAGYFNFDVTVSHYNIADCRTAVISAAKNSIGLRHNFLFFYGGSHVIKHICILL